MADMLKEYRSWAKENQDLYEEMKEHRMALYDRFMPVHEVLDFIEREASGGQLAMNDDLDKIFSVGFEYLHDQFETCKLYLDTYFHKDFHSFMEYDEALSTLLYLEDVRYELAEKNATYDKKKLDKLIDEVESILQNQKKIPDNYILYVDDIVKSALGEAEFDFYGIIDIFIDVAETLGIYLFEDEDLTLGKDIEE